MGAGYKIRCPKCGHEFDQLTGVGFQGVVPAGATATVVETFSCSECNHIFNPSAEDFEECVESHYHWD